MAVSTQEILDTISKMTVIEVVDLISAMEEKFGVSAAAVAVAAAPAAGGVAAAAEEKTEFTVEMTAFGDNKVGVIKAIRAITSLEGVPSVVKEGISKADAESIKKQLEEAGAKVVLK